jgi:hypothetical protein
MLAYASPGGLPPLPGHGHQDIGSFELHHGAVVVVRDPGRGTYMNTDDLGGEAQNGISISGADPFPVNRAYYDEEFRRAVGGAPPELRLQDDEASVTHDGFARLPGVGRVTRRWRFATRSVHVEDEIAGSGARSVTRRLHTALPVHLDDGAAILDGRFRIRADAPLRLRAATCWIAYGEGVTATCIEATSRATLPARLCLDIETI